MDFGKFIPPIFRRNPARNVEDSSPDTAWTEEKVLPTRSPSIAVSPTSHLPLTIPAPDQSQPALPVPHIQPVSLLRFSDSLDLIRATLGAHTGAIVIRRYATERTEALLVKGTDRRPDSRIWRHEGCDFKDTGSDSIPADRIIYGYEIEDINEHYLRFTSFAPVYMMSVGRNTLPVFLRMLDIDWPGDSLAIYDSAHLRRVALCEYWFEGDPCDALLAVFEKGGRQLAEA